MQEENEKFLKIFRSVCACQNNDPGLAKLESLGRSGGLRSLRSPCGHGVGRLATKKAGLYAKKRGAQALAQKKAAPCAFAAPFGEGTGLTRTTVSSPTFCLIGSFLIRSGPIRRSLNPTLACLFAGALSSRARRLLFVLLAGGPGKNRGLCSRLSFLGLRLLPVLLRGSVCDGFFPSMRARSRWMGKDPVRGLALRAPPAGPFRCASAAAGSNAPLYNSPSFGRRAWALCPRPSWGGAGMARGLAWSTKKPKRSKARFSTAPT